MITPSAAVSSALLAHAHTTTVKVASELSNAAYVLTFAAAALLSFSCSATAAQLLLLELGHALRELLHRTDEEHREASVIQTKQLLQFTLFTDTRLPAGDQRSRGD